MKKIFVIVITLTLLLVICGVLASSHSSRMLNPIDYGKKYILDDDNYYVFNSDKTGYCKYYSNGYYSVLSCTVDFEWREASNGGVYLFDVETHYNEEHTSEIHPLINMPIYFSEEFFTYEESNQYGNYSVCFVKEGSDLEKPLQKEEK